MASGSRFAHLPGDATGGASATRGGAKQRIRCSYARGDHPIFAAALALA
jgi:hypothetical protein